MSYFINGKDKLNRLSAAQIMRPLIGIPSSQPVLLVLTRFAREQFLELPVVEHDKLVGWLSEVKLLELLAGNEFDLHHTSAAEMMLASPAILTTGMLLPEIHEVFQQAGASLLPVVDEDENFVGVVSSKALMSATKGMVEAPRIGGMATPLGVCLTTGRVTGGAGFFGLLLTGVELALLLWGVQLLMLLFALTVYIKSGANFWLYTLYMLGLKGGIFADKLPPPSAIQELLFYLVISIIITTGYLLGIRFLPRMAGYHAAEHQTVNALEQGVPLRADMVAMMSRVHPRCGTNIGALLALVYLAGSLLLILMSTQLAQRNLPVVLLIIVWSAILIASNWKRIGGWVQLHLTTRPASDREIASGIRAGEEVMANHLRANKFLKTRRWNKIWNMGIAQVLIGAMLAVAALDCLEGPLIKWFLTLLSLVE